MKSCSVQVFGKVQGVWFRYFTRQEAQKLDLGGFVRNQGDGTVYLEVSGPDEKVDQLLAWCAVGPPMAKVEKLIVDELGSIHEGTFDIRK